MLDELLGDFRIRVVRVAPRLDMRGRLRMVIGVTNQSALSHILWPLMLAHLDLSVKSGCWHNAVFRANCHLLRR